MNVRLEQRMTDTNNMATTIPEIQRVSNEITMFQRVGEVPPTMIANNPTSK